MSPTGRQLQKINLQLPPGRPLVDPLRFAGLDGFFGSPFLKLGFQSQFDRALVVNPDAFQPEHLADLGDIFGAIHAEVSQLGNVNKAVFAREHFDERAEFFDRDNATMIGLADFNLARHAADNLLRAGHALGARRVNVNGTVVVDVNLSSGLGDDALDGLATRPDECADLFRIDFDRLDARRVLAEIGP